MLQRIKINTSARGKNKDDGFPARIRGAMKTCGIRGPTDLAKRLSKRLGRAISRQTVYKWINGDVASIRIDVMLAVGEELGYDWGFLATGKGVPQRKRPLDQKMAALCDVYDELTVAGKDELISYAYRLARINGKPILVAAYPPAAPAIKRK